jgi:hypothetical protein
MSLKASWSYQSLLSFTCGTDDRVEFLRTLHTLNAYFVTNPDKADLLVGIVQHTLIERQAVIREMNHPILRPSIRIKVSGLELKITIEYHASYNHMSRRRNDGLFDPPLDLAHHGRAQILSGYLSWKTVTGKILPEIPLDRRKPLQKSTSIPEVKV